MVLPPRAYVFISLNVVRFLSIIGLILVFSSSILVMVQDIKAVQRGDDAKMVTVVENNVTETFECDYYEHSTVPNQALGIGMAVLNRLFIISLTILLFLAEICVFPNFFLHQIPVLGPDFGVGPLGTIQVLLAASILSHHLDAFPLVAAFWLFAIGLLNIFLGFVFRKGIKIDRSLSTFRDAKAKELLPEPYRAAVDAPKTLKTAFGSILSEKKGRGADISRQNTGTSQGTTPGYGFGRQGEKAAANMGYIIDQPDATLPRYAPRPSRFSPTPPPVEQMSERSLSPPISYRPVRI